MQTTLMGPLSSNSEDVCLPLEFNEITDELRLKAERQLHETEKARLTCLEKLKEILKSEKNLFPDTSDEFLIQFLRVRKFDSEVAFTWMKKYYNHRRIYPSLYERFNPRYSMDVLESNLFNYLPKRSPEGCSIWVVKFDNWNPKAITSKEALRFALMCNTLDLQNPVTQIAGIISLIDLKGFSLSHLLSLTLSDITCVVSAVQDCVPMRHKSIHIVNNPSIFAFLFGVIKPLLREKMKQRIYFHGGNFTSLHQYLPPSILPVEYGGTQQSALPNERFFKTLLDNEDQIAATQDFGYKS